MREDQDPPKKSEESDGQDAPQRGHRKAPPSPPTEDDDPFARAAQARKERAASGGPKIIRKPMAIPPTLKMKPWFRVHPEAVFPGVAIYTDPSSEEMETTPYLVGPDIIDELEGTEGLTFYTAYLAATSGGKCLLFLVKEADADGTLHRATEQKHEAAEEAKESWVRMSWSREAMMYEIATAEWKKEPRWPSDISEPFVLRQAFGKQLIDSLDHPAIKNALGLE